MSDCSITYYSSGGPCGPLYDAGDVMRRFDFSLSSRRLSSPSVRRLGPPEFECRSYHVLMSDQYHVSGVSELNRVSI